MKTSVVNKLVISVSLLIIILTAFPVQLSANTKSKAIKYTGLTKTLGSLLSSRPVKSIHIGAWDIPPSKLFDADISRVFDCDSVIGRYLDEAGDDATYEMMADMMKTTIKERFKSEDGELFVSVTADTTSDGMYFKFEVLRVLPVHLPVILDASDGYFSTAFDTTCNAKFEADIDVYVNTGMALKDLRAKAVRIRINKYAVDLYTGSDPEYVSDDSGTRVPIEEADTPVASEPDYPVPFRIEEKHFSAGIGEFSVYASVSWYLSPDGTSDFSDDDGNTFIVSCEQLEKGNYRWDVPCMSSMTLNMVMLPSGEKWDSVTIADNSSSFSYVVENLFDDSVPEDISLCCDYFVKEGVTARNRRFTYGK